jgi:hypothetical protein
MIDRMRKANLSESRQKSALNFNKLQQIFTHLKPNKMLQIWDAFPLTKTRRFMLQRRK